MNEIGPPPPPDLLPLEASRPEAVPATRTPAQATRGQRIALLAGLAVVAWLALKLFASILLPFVAAAGIAYVLDPATTRLTRAGVPRGLATLAMIVGLLAAALLFALLLYPVILSQAGLLIGRVPQYVVLLQGWARELITHLQDRFGHDVVDDKLRDLVGGQAGAMLSFIATALSHLIGGSFALFNVVSLIVVTPVVAFYLLRDWPGVVARLDGWLPRRYAGVIRAQSREVDRILSAWVRGQALCCLILALYYAAALSMVGLGPRADRRPRRRAAVVHPLCRFDRRRSDRDRPRAGAVPELARRDAGGRGARRRADPGRLRDLSALPRRPGGAAGGLGDLRAVRRRRGVRLRRHHAGGAGGGDHRGAVPLLAASLPGQPALSRPAQSGSERGVTASPQLLLPFPDDPDYAAADFLQAPSNAEALAWVGDAGRWPGGRLVIWGEPGCGKSHLLTVWAKATGGTLHHAPELRGIPERPGTGLAIDAADRPAEEAALLHLLNAAQEAGRPVLMAAHEPPARWTLRLADLASRVRSTAAVRILPPEDALLRALLARLLGGAAGRRGRGGAGVPAASPAAHPGGDPRGSRLARPRGAGGGERGDPRGRHPGARQAGPGGRGRQSC